MAYRWRAVGGPTLCAFWAGNFSFISAKTYDLGGKKEQSRREGPFKHPSLGFGCFASIVKLCFDETALLST